MLRGRRQHGSRPGCDKCAKAGRLPRSRRMCGIGAILDPAGALRARRRRADGRSASPPRARRRGRPAHRPGRARPHPAGDHRRRGRRPAARLRGRRGDPHRQRRRSTTTVALRAKLERARPPLRHRLGLRGDPPRLRGERAGLRARAERDLRLRALGRPAAQALVAARDEFGVKPLYWWSDGRRVAWPRRSGRCWTRGWRRPEVDRMALDHYLACRFVPAPRTLFAGIRSCRRRRRWWPRRAAPPRVETWRAAPGEPHRDLSDDALAEPTWPSASPTRSSAR